MNRTYCVYILASRSRNLYTGMGNNLERRMIEHRQELVPGFTGRYRIFRLVHFELFGDVRDAIAREKEIKGWRREKKIRLIERHNPTWTDLAEQLPAKYQKADPSHRSPKSGERVRDDKEGGSPNGRERVRDDNALGPCPSPRVNQPPAPGTEPPAPTPVIPNRSTASADLTPGLLPSTSRPKAREGSAFSSTLPKPTAKP